MNSTNLDNLIKIRLLKNEPPDKMEILGLFHSGEARLKDACNTTLAIESRFDLAYNAAHSLALAALRSKGYRSDKRYIVFEVLPYTANISAEICRVLELCHKKRNRTEYEGYLEIDNQLLEDLILATKKLLEQVSQLVI